AHDVRAPAAAQIGFDLLERASLVLRIPAREVAGDVCRTHVLIGAVSRSILGALEILPECDFVMLGDRAGDALPRPPASDRTGYPSDDEPDRTADGADRHAAHGAEKAARAFAYRISVPGDALRRALSRRPTLWLCQ